MNNEKNAVAYIRVSTNLQIDGFSLEGQLKEIQDYCKRNNINLLKYYKDAGISGTSTEDRTDFQRMLNDISRDMNIRTVIVWKLSRLSRSMADLANTVTFLEKYNVNLICITQGIDTANPMGKSFVYMSGIFAEMERDNIIETCKMGMKQRAIDGKWNGGKVFGYRSSEDKELVIVEDEAVVIKEIFHLFTDENLGYKKIACTLNSKGLKTMKGTDWSISSIKQIIDNPIYAGYIRWGQYMDWSKKRRQGKKEEYVLSEGTHIPIITKEMWERSRKIRDVRGKQNEKIYDGDYLLSGLIRCPVCGASMISHRTPKKSKPGEYYRYYQCSSFFNKGSKVCSSNLINADKAEEYVLSRIYNVVNSKEVVNAIVSKVEKQSITDIAPLESDLVKLKKKLEKINDKKSENLQLEYENKIDVNALSQRLAFLDKKEAEINDKINSIGKEISSIDSQIKVRPEKVRAILENFTKIFEKADIDKKKMLLKSIIESISVTNGKSSRDKKVDKIKLYFEPEEIQALNSNKKFATTYDTVHHALF